MPTVIPIDDPADPRVAVYVGLTDHHLRIARERRDPELGAVFIVEGDRLIANAIDHGMELLSILRSPDRPTGIEHGLPEHVPVYTAGPELAVRLTGMHIHRGTLACFARPQEATVQEVIADATTVLVGERVINPTNLGVMTRSAAGVGVDALVVDDESCDPLYRRAHRVAMGASLTMPWARVHRVVDAIESLRRAGFTTVAMALAADAVPLHLLRPRSDRIALIVGNEFTGLSEAVIDASDVVATIPMHGGVDSLNVAAAAAIACWEITRHRRDSPRM
jgi:tRNA G18 (ribose-2'-O)-methylase SpoU